MSRAAGLASLAVPVVILLSGCAELGGDSGNPAATARLGAEGKLAAELDRFWAERALPFGEDHDHFKIDQHLGFTTPNFGIVGHNPLVSPSLGRTPGGHFCGDAQVTPNGKRLAAVEMRAVGGFALADVTDPEDPKWLGEFIMRTSRVYDLAVVPDGRHVLLVTTDQPPPVPAPTANAELPTEGLYWRDACRPDAPVLVGGMDAEDPVPRPMSFILVSIENPSQPVVVDQRPIPRAGHSVFSTIIDGRTWILLAVYGYGVPGGSTDYFQFYELVSTPLGPRLQLHSMFLLKTGANELPSVIRVHDGWIAKHPKTNRLTAYLAGGDDFFTVDLTNPSDPKVLGRWSDVVQPRRSYMGNLHSVFPMRELWDNRHYTLLGPEFGGRPGERPSGTLWVLDTTDPARIIEVGAWTLPYQVEWSGTYMFSNHYFSAVGRTAFISMYHGGVWAIDLSAVKPDTFTLLPSIGVFAPELVSEKPPTQLLRWTPNFQEVLDMPDGTLVTFDEASGLYTLGFDDFKPMVPPTPWRIEPITKR